MKFCQETAIDSAATALSGAQELQDICKTGFASRKSKKQISSPNQSKDFVFRMELWKQSCI